MQLHKIVLVALGITIVPQVTQARDLTDMSIEITTEKSAGEAKQEAFDQATEQATLKLTEDLLGSEKTAKFWPGLKAKLLKNSTRFLVFIKGSPPVEEAGQTKIRVTMRLSPDNLESILREEGLLNTGGTLKVLPLIEIVDNHGVHFNWWVDGVESGQQLPLEEAFKRFYNSLAGKFKAKSVFVLDPTNASFRMSVPAAYRSAGLRREDQMLLAQYLKADIVISGKIEIARPRSENSDLKLNYDLQVWQAKSGRPIGEIQRGEALTSEVPKVVQATLDQTAPKVAEELATKVSDALTGGGLNLNLVRVAVTGALNFKQQSEFKRQLAQMREIKVLKERLFEPNRVVFEVETAVTGQELAKSMQKTHFVAYAVEVDGAQDDSLALSVKALNSPSAQ